MSEHFDPAPVRKREEGRLAWNNYVNELNDRIQRALPLPTTGNADPPLNVAASHDTSLHPVYQYTFIQAVADNTEGADLMMAGHPLE